MNHDEYVKKTKRMSDSSLEYVRDDARAAYLAQPDGLNAGYYADEYSYCAMELAIRRIRKEN
jgi:hypothetical protein